jgi:hypothetical protein
LIASLNLGVALENSPVTYLNQKQGDPVNIYHECMKLSKKFLGDQHLLTQKSFLFHARVDALNIKLLPTSDSSNPPSVVRFNSKKELQGILNNFNSPVKPTLSLPNKSFSTVQLLSPKTLSSSFYLKPESKPSKESKPQTPKASTSYITLVPKSKTTSNHSFFTPVDPSEITGDIGTPMKKTIQIKIRDSNNTATTPHFHPVRGKAKAYVVRTAPITVNTSKNNQTDPEINMSIMSKADQAEIIKRASEPRSLTSTKEYRKKRFKVQDSSTSQPESDRENIPSRGQSSNEPDQSQLLHLSLQLMVQHQRDFEDKIGRKIEGLIKEISDRKKAQQEESILLKKGNTKPAEPIMDMKQKELEMQLQTLQAEKEKILKAKVKSEMEVAKLAAIIQMKSPPQTGIAGVDSPSLRLTEREQDPLKFTSRGDHDDDNSMMTIISPKKSNLPL